MSHPKDPHEVLKVRLVSSRSVHLGAKKSSVHIKVRVTFIPL